MYRPVMTRLHFSSWGFTPCACLDYMLYTLCCVLHTPCACTYDNLLASQDVFIAIYISSLAEPRLLTGLVYTTRVNV